MEHFSHLRLGLLLFFLLSLHARYGFTQDDDFDCYSECFGVYLANTATTDCSLLEEAIICYEDHIDACWDQSFQNPDIYNEIFDTFDAVPCTFTADNSETPSSSTTPSTFPLCPSVPATLQGDLLENFNQANVFPNVHPPHCTMYDPDDLQHCSMFTYSHIRPFKAYRRGLETCSIPGSWYLFRHSTFSVQVEGLHEELGSNHTKLSRINVTFYEQDCLGETKSYVVDHRSPLPTTFTDSTVTDPQNSALLLQVDEDGSLATLLALWVNATIVIRRHEGFLSVTLQVPGRVSFQSDGLCTGCPPHAYVNITDYKNKMQDLCIAETSAVSTNCFLHAGVQNQQSFSPIVNNTYLEACVYSLYKGGNVSILELFNRIASDAKLLPSRGFVPPRPGPIDSIPPDLDRTPVELSTDDDGGLESTSSNFFTEDSFSSALSHIHLSLSNVIVVLLTSIVTVSGVMSR